MPFEKGHKLSKGRPKGSLNKANSETKEFIHDIIYNEDEWLTEWKTLDVRTKFEIMRVDGDDSEVTEAEKAFLWELYDGNLPLFLRKDIIYHAENKDTFHPPNDSLTE